MIYLQYANVLLKSHWVNHIPSGREETTYLVEVERVEVRRVIEKRVVCVVSVVVFAKIVDDDGDRGGGDVADDVVAEVDVGVAYPRAGRLRDRRHHPTPPSGLRQLLIDGRGDIATTIMENLSSHCVASVAARTQASASSIKRTRLFYVSQTYVTF